jgi:hypothetical protein
VCGRRWRESPIMDASRFDGLTRLFVRKTSRRRALAALAAVVAGQALPDLDAGAASRVCRHPGSLCIRDTQCCTSRCVAGRGGSRRCAPCQSGGRYCRSTGRCLAGACPGGSKWSEIVCDCRCNDRRSPCDGTCCQRGQVCATMSPDADPICCLPGLASCNDGSECCSDVCNPVTGLCEFVPQPLGYPCADEGDCAEGTCFSNVCRAAVGEGCGANNECTTLVCDYGTDVCGDGDYAVGAACRDGSHCETGFCSASNACCSGGTVSCSADADCCSNICNPDTLVCEYGALPNGFACRNDAHCANGACISGACKGAAGATCANNAGCASAVCDYSTDVCGTGGYAVGQACRDNSHCASSYCNNIKLCCAGFAVACSTGADCCSNNCNAGFCGF